MTTFLHLSDLHIPDHPGELWDGVDLCRKLDALIELASKLDFRPAFTIITGDLSHTGTLGSYQLVKQYLAKIQKLGGPVFPLIGNMDHRANFRHNLLQDLSLPHSTHCYYSQTIDGLHVIGMDSQSSDFSTGCFGKDQLCWLQTELGTHPNKPLFIGFHFPVFFWGRYGAFDKDAAMRFRELVSQRNVLAVLNGHLHFPLFTVIDDIHYVQAGSPTFENAYTSTGRSSYNSSSFNVVEVDDGRLLVHPVSFSEETQLIERTSE